MVIPYKMPYFCPPQTGDRVREGSTVLLYREICNQRTERNLLLNREIYKAYQRSKVTQHYRKK